MWLHLSSGSIPRTLTFTIHNYKFKTIEYCNFPWLRNPGCLLLVAIFAVLWENAVPSESFLARLRRRLQHFHNPCKFFFFSRGTVLLWCAGFVRRDLVRQTFWMFSNYWPGSNASQNNSFTFVYFLQSPFFGIPFNEHQTPLIIIPSQKSHDISAG